ncbi:hypothetical protein RMCBS344292_01934 [Rhizopus microsporus]|nr:hypothetical protein RMCBS344292_01934 [Rhizopus microsporus]
MEEWMTVETEYKKLQSDWTSLNTVSLNSPNLLFVLFSNYLSQIWTDAQSMLQCAQFWQSIIVQGHDLTHLVQTMNSLGLHLMKQSLQTRQEMLNIVSRDDNDTFYSTISPSLYQVMPVESMVFTPTKVKLMRSPSAPTPSSSITRRRLLSCCYSKAMPSIADSKWNRCQEHGLLKRSLSFEYYQTAVNGDSSEEEEEEEDNILHQHDELPTKVEYESDTYLEENRSMLYQPSDLNGDLSACNLSNTATLSSFSTHKVNPIPHSSSQLFENTHSSGDTIAFDNYCCEKVQVGNSNDIQKSSSSTYKAISNSILQPFWSIRLALKKRRSQKVEAKETSLQTRPKKGLGSKFYLKKKYTQ